MKKYYKIFLILIFIVGAFLRLYNFPDRIIFGPEQGISLLTSSSYLEKFSLLGEVNVQRATSTGLNPFHGAYFNYSLVPLIILFDYKVLPITYAFAVLNILTAIVLFLVSKKIFGGVVAFFSSFYFLISPLMIHHSLFIWNLNLLPILGIVILWLLFDLYNNRRRKGSVILLGVAAGLGFGLQYLFLPFGFIVFLAILFIFGKRLVAMALFIVGAIFGNLSMVIFDLRHNFYTVRVLWQYSLDVISGQITGATHYYDFLYLYPYFLIICGIATSILFKISKPLAIVFILFFISASYPSPLVNLSSSTGMPPGLTLTSLETAAATIAADKPPKKFNVATLWDFDTLARPMRYLLAYYHNLTPQGYADYGNVDALYVFAPVDRDINSPKVWELNTFMPYKITILASPSPQYNLYKLTK